ncbi:MAG: hypothetical protein ACHRHE_15440 [Tepidisphaerales bacterium]
MRQNPPSVPAQPIPYPSPENAWVVVVRLVAIFGLAMGCVWLAQLAQLFWAILGGPYPLLCLYPSTPGGVGFLLFGLGGILSTIGSIGLLCRYNLARFVIAGCWLLLSASVLGLVMLFVDYMIAIFAYSSGNPSRGIVPSRNESVFLVSTLSIWSAMLPLMIVLLLRKAMRDPRLRATLGRRLPNDL